MRKKTPKLLDACSGFISVTKGVIILDKIIMVLSWYEPFDNVLFKIKIIIFLALIRLALAKKNLL